MTQQTAKLNQGIKSAAKSRKAEPIEVVIHMSPRTLQRLGKHAARAGMRHAVGAYLVACEKEFGHNLWLPAEAIPKVGGTD